jgi:steroid 5-alpha reductase family enzyme
MYWFQGLLVIAISFPFLLVATDPYHPINNWEFAGLIIAVAAMFGEAVADAQLACFKSRNQDKGKICKIGLWSVSRHPNYFFEWLVWVGVFVFALGSPYGIYAIISPLLMYYLLVYVSGIPPLEKQMKSSKKEAYEEYVEMVPAFFPKIRLNEL